MDYAFFAGSILACLVGVWLVFSLAPGLIRWARTSPWELLKESMSPS